MSVINVNGDVIILSYRDCSIPIHFIKDEFSHFGTPMCDKTTLNFIEGFKKNDRSSLYICENNCPLNKCDKLKVSSKYEYDIYHYKK
jgi:hypothetical protein